MNVLRLLLVGLVALTLSVRAQTDLEYAKALTVVYASGKALEYVKGWCDRNAPSTTALTNQVLTAWRDKYRLALVEQELFRLLNDSQKASLQQNLEASRQKLETQLNTTIQNPLKECQGLEADVNTNFNLRQLYPNEMQLLDARLPADTTTGGSAVTPAPTSITRPPNPSPTPSAKQGVVYTVAQIAAVYESAYRKASGDGSAKRKTGEAAIKALGSSIYVTGTLETEGRWLEFQNAKFQSRYDVNCQNFLNENDGFSGKKAGGKPFTLQGSFDKYDVFFYFKDCQTVTSTAGLKPSSLDASLGLTRKPVPSETFLVPAGAGLKDTQIYGFYLHQYYETGVGGYLYPTYEPWLLLKDGTVHNEPVIAPSRFNVALSKQEEPQRWGRWTAQKNGAFMILWYDDTDNKPESYNLTQTSPGSSNQRLNGYFERLTGGGNTAYGGNTSIVAYSGYTFNADGTFEFSSGAGGSTGNDYNTGGAGPNVAFSNTNGTKKGTYKISGYNMELRYPDGKVVSRSFCMSGGSKDPTGLIYIGGTYYLKK